MYAFHPLVEKAGPPDWVSHLHPPLPPNFDPKAEALAAIATGRKALEANPLLVKVVNNIFTLLQLALDKRCSKSCPPCDKALEQFRSSVTSGALGLVNSLTAAQQAVAIKATER
ncbi:unnamed protein product, partial [Discosporangium mesarthrocarpum]